MQSLASMTATFVQHTWFGHHHVREDNACTTAHPSPILSEQHISQQALQFAKRKRFDSDSFVQDLKRQRQVAKPDHATELTAEVTQGPEDRPQVLETSDQGQLATAHSSDGQIPSSQESQAVAGAVSSHDAPAEAAQDASVTSASARSKCLDRISVFLSTNIVLKHKELRLIDTEIAKCQIALEQLRRCRAQPYAAVPDAFASHASSSVSPPNGQMLDSIHDGAYTRHYAQWLLPNTPSDGLELRTPRALGPVLPPTITSGRKSKVIDENAPIKSKRATTSMFLQLPTSSALFKDHKNRLIVRNNDGDWVKIVCRQCGKADSANLQGFTNHTRIAHQMSYTKHDDAVKECGQLLDEEERSLLNASAASLAGEETALSQSPMLLQRSQTSSLPGTPMPVADRQQVNILQSLQRPQNQLPRTFSIHEYKAVTKPTSTCAEDAKPKSDAPSAPALGNLIRKRGLQIELDPLVQAVTQRIDVTQVMPLVSDDEAESPVKAESSNDNSRFSSRRAGPVDTTLSSGSKYPSDKHRHASDVSSRATQNLDAEDVNTEHSDQSPHISPRMLDGDPGLVTDRGDDDDDDADSSQASEHGGEDATNDRGHGHVVHVRRVGSIHEEDDTMQEVHLKQRMITETTNPFQTQPQITQATEPEVKKKKRGRPRKLGSVQSAV